MTAYNIDPELELERVEGESLMPSTRSKAFKDAKILGALRFATYIENYSELGTFKQFCKSCTEDDLVDMEQLYRDDWAMRKYSKAVKQTVSKEQIALLTDEHWQKLARIDIAQFYKFAEETELFKKNDNLKD